MPWRNDPLVLYHGTVGIFATDIEAHRRPDLAKCRRRRDFGQGFYMTRRPEQARDFANALYQKMRYQLLHTGRGPNPQEAAIVEFTVDRNTLGRLDTLAFV